MSGGGATEGFEKISGPSAEGDKKSGLNTGAVRKAGSGTVRRWPRLWFLFSRTRGELFSSESFACFGRGKGTRSFRILEAGSGKSFFGKACFVDFDLEKFLLGS
uniref:Uncharacterized protein n=1 Tax=Rhodosorus marinus TaxID=101924 RepID=A0A7S3E600_9RHOD